MKTRAISLLLVLSLTAGVFYACKKDSTDKCPGTDNSTTITEEGINSFINLAALQKEGKLLKSTEKMSIDTALYNIGAAFNYAYCFPHGDYAYVKFDTAYVKIPVLDQNTKTWLSDALSAYNLSISKVTEKYKAIQGGNKKLLAVVVQNAGGSPANDTVLTRVIALTGFGTRIVPEGNFGPDDQYWWTADGGNCTDINNIEYGDGAPLVLANVIRMSLTPLIRPGYRIYYTDSKIHTYSDPTEHINAGVKDNFCDYKFYYATEYLNNTLVSLDPEVFCLGLDPSHLGEHEMNYYFGNMIGVFSEDFFSNGRDFMDVTIYDRAKPNLIPGQTNSYFYEYMHDAVLTHGIRHIVRDDIYPIDITNNSVL